MTIFDDIQAALIECETEADFVHAVVGAWAAFVADEAMKPVHSPRQATLREFDAFLRDSLPLERDELYARLTNAANRSIWELASHARTVWTNEF